MLILGSCVFLHGMFFVPVAWWPFPPTYCELLSHFQKIEGTDQQKSTRQSQGLWYQKWSCHVSLRRKSIRPATSWRFNRRSWNAFIKSRRLRLHPLWPHNLHPKVAMGSHHRSKLEDLKRESLPQGPFTMARGVLKKKKWLTNDSQSHELPMFGSKSFGPSVFGAPAVGDRTGKIFGEVLQHCFGICFLSDIFCCSCLVSVFFYDFSDLFGLFFGHVSDFFYLFG